MPRLGVTDTDRLPSATLRVSLSYWPFGVESGKRTCVYFKRYFGWVGQEFSYGGKKRGAAKEKDGGSLSYVSIQPVVWAVRAKNVASMTSGQGRI